MLDRHGLGRFRVTQKANLDDPTDGYRSENAETPDWAMLGNHDTPPVFQLVHAWSEERRGKWATHLRERLSLDAAAERAIAAEPRVLAQTMLAELFACPAENVSIFFGDLFGYDRSFNVPGLVSDENWSLRLPADFEDLYLGRLAERAALDIPLALAIALEARRPTSETARALAARLRVLASALAGVTSARA